MKVRELIELLEQQDEDSEVRVLNNEDDEEFCIERVVRQNDGCIQVNILVW